MRNFTGFKIIPTGGKDGTKILRRDVINYLVEKYQLRNYLEIGVRDPDATFNKVRCRYKNGVDPEPLGKEVTFPCTSDEFFDMIKDDKEVKFDIIFIDGLHLTEQVDKDVENSLEHLVDWGFIVMHDCSPPNEFRQRENYEVDGSFPAWNGTVWKSWVKLRCAREDLKMYVVDENDGCGVIHRGEQKIWDKDTVEECIEYKYLEKNREELLHLVSAEEFTEVF